MEPDLHSFVSYFLIFQCVLLFQLQIWQLSQQMQAYMYIIFLTDN